ncbi:MAG: aminotransferase class I/II-fold pyridoxal phosphate-dependent enzyme [Acidobacteria bacterium]|nr:aminotransferase class I/II-fold pyridoxal phosphate-dependent enzyme [Acidobacteriota bacterium]
MTQIFLSPPWVDADERQALLDAFDSNWIAPVGPNLAEFEKAGAVATGTAHGVALTSGTAALHLALDVLGIGPGDEVVVSDLTFAASAFAVVHAGAYPSFVDADRSTWCIDPELLEEHLLLRTNAGHRPKAIVSVDLYGQCADYDAIRATAKRWEIPVIQDAAESLGATHRDKPAGAQGDLSCLSFNGNKIVTTSGGGMLVGDDGALIDRARHLATQARQPVEHYEHDDIGYNYRLSNLLAALGEAQLRRLPAKLRARAAIHTRYREGLDGLEGIDFMPVADYGVPNHWLTVITIDPAVFGADRTQVSAVLREADIESRPAWKPMHLQPVFASNPLTGGLVGERIYEHGLCLPSGDLLDEADQDRIIALIAAQAGSHPTGIDL